MDAANWVQSESSTSRLRDWNWLGSLERLRGGGVRILNIPAEGLEPDLFPAYHASDRVRILNIPAEGLEHHGVACGGIDDACQNPQHPG